MQCYCHTRWRLPRRVFAQLNSRCPVARAEVLKIRKRPMTRSRRHQRPGDPSTRWDRALLALRFATQKPHSLIAQLKSCRMGCLADRTGWLNRSCSHRQEELDCMDFLHTPGIRIRIRSTWSRGNCSAELNSSCRGAVRRFGSGERWIRCRASYRTSISRAGYLCEVTSSTGGLTCKRNSEGGRCRKRERLCRRIERGSLGAIDCLLQLHHWLHLARRFGCLRIQAGKVLGVSAGGRSIHAR